MFIPELLISYDKDLTSKLIGIIDAYDSNMWKFN